jgi:surface protein
MATLSDLNTKRVEMNTAVDNYKQALLDFDASTITLAQLNTAKQAAIAKGDEYAKLTAQVKQDDPAVTNDDQLFSRPAAMSALVRDDIATILMTGKLFGAGMKLLVDTEGSTVGATNVILSFATGSAIDIDWGDGSSVQSYTGAASHNYAAPGQYTVEVHGTVNGFTNPLIESRRQLKDVMQWGSVEFESANNMFVYRTGFVISASDGPTFLPGASCDMMFYSATDFNSNIDHWNTTNVISMTHVFGYANTFNQPLNSWDVSNVTNMQYMFANAKAFNQPLNTWDVSSVTNMDHMFKQALVFNQYIKGWDVSNVTSYASFADYSSLLSTNAPNFT